MFSAVLMMARLRAVLRHAVRDEGFLPVGSAAVTLILIGAVAYAFGEGWSPVDAVYFAATTLTTTNVADPDLVLTSGWLKIFTVLYQLVGIGILVELLRRLGQSFVAVRSGADVPRR